ncbi:helix-turn-helix domain-containing protein [Acinetobacter defluvii]|uniref:helix-turn-helix domain-containing protein n=1 Tax=Acinetobacter defluvii TaxID=1871111 RepID=UPI003AF56715
MKSQKEKKDGRLVGENIVLLAKEHFGVDYHTDAIYAVLKRLGMSWITGCSQHSKADPEKVS